MGLRQKLLEGKNALVPRENMPIDTGDGIVSVQVRGLSSGDRGDLMMECVDTVEDADGNTTQRTNLKKLQPALVIRCLYDPESGEKLFTEEDRELLLTLDGSYLYPAIKKAMRLSGIDDSAAKGAEKNSELTGDSSGSGSSSPANSA